jgi:serine/threonine protein kinase
VLLEHRFGPYELIKRLGLGEMFEVLLARSIADAGPPRMVVLRRLLPQHTGDSRFNEFFAAQGRIAGALDHVNMAQIVEVGRINKRPFLATEFVEGRSLAEVLGDLWRAGDALPLETALEIARAITAAMAHAHRKQPALVHGHLNPRRIRLSFSGAIKIVDFGLDQLELREVKTFPGRAEPRYVYLAPERVSGCAASSATDVYSLGAILFELHAGQAFPGSSAPDRPEETSLPLLPLRHGAQVEIAADLETLVARALRRDARDRLTSAEEMSAVIASLTERTELRCDSRQISGWLRSRHAELEPDDWRKMDQDLIEHIGLESGDPQSPDVREFDSAAATDVDTKRPGHAGETPVNADKTEEVELDPLPEQPTQPKARGLPPSMVSDRAASLPEIDRVRDDPRGKTETLRLKREELSLESALATRSRRIRRLALLGLSLALGLAAAAGLYLMRC